MTKGWFRTLLGEAQKSTIGRDDAGVKRLFKVSVLRE